MKSGLSLFAAVSVACAMAGGAFARVPIGGRLENVELPTLAGKPCPLLSNATANVFIFFKPGQEQSRTALIQLAACQKEMATQSVHWVAVVSDRVPKPAVETMVKETGLAMPVLIDKDDALYGKLGLALCPVVGIADQDHNLVACEYFTKINFPEVVRARLRYLLQEITRQELEWVLNPPEVILSADADVARRRLKLGERLFQAKNYEKALENVNKSLEKDPTAAAAYVLKGRILAAQNNKDAARRAFGAALKLDTANTNALEGLKACEK